MHSIPRRAAPYICFSSPKTSARAARLLSHACRTKCTPLQLAFDWSFPCRAAPWLRHLWPAPRGPPNSNSYRMDYGGFSLVLIVAFCFVFFICLLVCFCLRAMAKLPRITALNSRLEAEFYRGKLENGKPLGPFLESKRKVKKPAGKENNRVDHTKEKPWSKSNIVFPFRFFEMSDLFDRVNLWPVLSFDVCHWKHVHLLCRNRSERRCCSAKLGDMVLKLFSRRPESRTTLRLSRRYWRKEVGHTVIQQHAEVFLLFSFY